MLGNWVKFEGKLTKQQKTIIKTSIFLIIATIPFISAASQMTMEQFLDSFENPEHYISIQNDNLIKSASQKEGYMIIQRSSCPDFEIKENDEIIYFESDGEIKCSTVIHSSKIGTIKHYYTINQDHTEEESVYENQIIGKVIKTMDDNLWNTISIRTWDISIHQLNINNIGKQN
jgi:hypothetical protein